MDISVALENLGAGTPFDYSGSLTGNDEAAYDALTWDDGRTKPTWDAVTAEWAVYELSDARAVRIAVIMAACDAAISEDVTYNSVVFQSGDQSRTRLAWALANYVTAGNSLPDPYTWRDKANIEVTFVLADLNGLSNAFALQFEAARLKCGVKKDYINDEARTAEEIEAVTWDSTE